MNERKYIIQDLGSDLGDVVDARQVGPSSGGGGGMTRTDVSGSTPSIEPAADTLYVCGELQTLTVTNPPATGLWCIIFVSGSTPTVTTFPAGVEGLDSFAAAANTRYEISVLDGYALVRSWGVSA